MSVILNLIVVVLLSNIVDETNKCPHKIHKLSECC